MEDYLHQKDEPIAEKGKMLVQNLVTSSVEIKRKRKQRKKLIFTDSQTIKLIKPINILTEMPTTEGQRYEK
jgi:hypothetical protein